MSRAVRMTARVLGALALLAAAVVLVPTAANLGWCAGDDCLGWHRRGILILIWVLWGVALLLAGLATRLLVARGRLRTHVIGWTLTAAALLAAAILVAG